MEQELPQHAAQKEFDSKYITSTEIMRRLGITRAALVYARKRNNLPEPIVVNDGQLFIWVRSSIEEYLSAWELVLNVRRGD